MIRKPLTVFDVAFQGTETFRTVECSAGKFVVRYGFTGKRYWWILFRRFRGNLNRVAEGRSFKTGIARDASMRRFKFHGRRK